MEMDTDSGYGSIKPETTETHELDLIVDCALEKVYEGLKDARSLGVYDLQAYVDTLRTIKELKSTKEVKK